MQTLSAQEQFVELCAELGREVTLMLKRLRKQTGVTFKYLLVFEKHKSGLPHCHMLMHEQSSDSPLRHAALTAQWKLGYSKFKLCESVKSAWYVSKYLAKSVEARVRASLRYGKVNPSLDIGEPTWPPVNKKPPHQNEFDYGGITKSETDTDHGSAFAPVVLSRTLEPGGTAFASSPGAWSGAASSAEPSSEAPFSGRPSGPPPLTPLAWAYAFARPWGIANPDASRRAGGPLVVGILPRLSKGS